MPESVGPYVSSSGSTSTPPVTTRSEAGQTQGEPSAALPPELLKLDSTVRSTSSESWELISQSEAGSMDSAMESNGEEAKTRDEYPPSESKTVNTTDFPSSSPPKIDLSSPSLAIKETRSRTRRRTNSAQKRVEEKFRGLKAEVRSGEPDVTSLSSTVPPLSSSPLSSSAEDLAFKGRDILAAGFNSSPKGHIEKPTAVEEDLPLSDGFGGVGESEREGSSGPNELPGSLSVSPSSKRDRATTESPSSGHNLSSVNGHGERVANVPCQLPGLGEAKGLEDRHGENMGDVPYQLPGLEGAKGLEEPASSHVKQDMVFSTEEASTSWPADPSHAFSYPLSEPTEVPHSSEVSQPGTPAAEGLIKQRDEPSLSPGKAIVAWPSDDTVALRQNSSDRGPEDSVAARSSAGDRKSSIGDASTLFSGCEDPVHSSSFQAALAQVVAGESDNFFASYGAGERSFDSPLGPVSSFKEGKNEAEAGAITSLTATSETQPTAMESFDVTTGSQVSYRGGREEDKVDRLLPSSSPYTGGIGVKMSELSEHFGMTSTSSLHVTEDGVTIASSPQGAASAASAVKGPPSTASASVSPLSSQSLFTARPSDTFFAMAQDRGGAEDEVAAPPPKSTLFATDSIPKPDDSPFVNAEGTYDPVKVDFDAQGTEPEAGEKTGRHLTVSDLRSPMTEHISPRDTSAFDLPPLTSLSSLPLTQPEITSTSVPVIETSKSSILEEDPAERQKVSEESGLNTDPLEAATRPKRSSVGDASTLFGDSEGQQSDFFGPVRTNSYNSPFSSTLPSSFPSTEGTSVSFGSRFGDQGSLPQEDTMFAFSTASEASPASSTVLFPVSVSPKRLQEQATFPSSAIDVSYSQTKKPSSPRSAKVSPRNSTQLSPRRDASSLFDSGQEEQKFDKPLEGGVASFPPPPGPDYWTKPESPPRVRHDGGEKAGRGDGQGMAGRDTEERRVIPQSPPPVAASLFSPLNSADPFLRERGFSTPKADASSLFTSSPKGDASSLFGTPPSSSDPFSSSATLMSAAYSLSATETSNPFSGPVPTSAYDPFSGRSPVIDNSFGPRTTASEAALSLSSTGSSTMPGSGQRPRLSPRKMAPPSPVLIPPKSIEGATLNIQTAEDALQKAAPMAPLQSFPASAPGSRTTSPSGRPRMHPPSYFGFESSTRRPPEAQPGEVETSTLKQRQEPPPAISFSSSSLGGRSPSSRAGSPKAAKTSHHSSAGRSLALETTDVNRSEMTGAGASSEQIYAAELFGGPAPEDPFASSFYNPPVLRESMAEVKQEEPPPPPVTGDVFGGETRNDMADIFSSEPTKGIAGGKFGAFEVPPPPAAELFGKTSPRTTSSIFGASSSTFSSPFPSSTPTPSSSWPQARNESENPASSIFSHPPAHSTDYGMTQAASIPAHSSSRFTGGTGANSSGIPGGPSSYTGPSQQSGSFSRNATAPPSSKWPLPPSAAHQKHPAPTQPSFAPAPSLAAPSFPAAPTDPYSYQSPLRTATRQEPSAFFSPTPAAVPSSAPRYGEAPSPYPSTFTPQRPPAVTQSYGTVTPNPLDMIKRQAMKPKATLERQASSEPFGSHSATSTFRGPRPPAWGLSSPTPVATGGSDSANSRYRDPTRKPPSAIVSFGFGGNLVVMHPKQKIKFINLAAGGPEPSEVQKGPIRIYSLKALLSSTQEVTQIFQFPGPLVSGRKLKSENILSYVDQMLATLKSSPAAFEEDEYLLWSAVRLLIKHNGSLSSEKGLLEPSSPENALLSLLKDQKQRKSPAPALPPPRLQRMKTAEDLRLAYENVKNCLSGGDREAAVTAALLGELWEMAFLIAATISQESYQRVVGQYVNSTFPFGDPLATVFGVFAGQGTKAIHEPAKLNPLESSQKPLNILDYWQENVGMLIANSTGPSTKQVLIELGDRLWNERGKIGAAHFCYLVSGMTLEPPSPSSRLVLIGGDHRSPGSRGGRSSLLSPSAIQRTEIYEWVLKQSNTQANLLSFQGYKLLHAMQLADYGDCDRALQYVVAIDGICKAAASAGARDPQAAAYAENILAQLAILEDRLRAHMGEAKAEEAANKSQGTGLLKRIFSGVDKVIERLADDSPKNAKKTGGPPPSASTSFYGSTALRPSAPASVTPPGGPAAWEQPAAAQAVAEPPPPLQMSLSARIPPVVDDKPTPPKRTNSSPNLAQGLSRDKTGGQKGPSSSPTQPRPSSQNDETSSVSSEGSRSKTPPRDAQKKKGGGWSITGWLAEKVIQSQNPDAKVAKLGKEMEAYYDEVAKRWVFPGEEASSTPPPPSAPPTAAELAKQAAPSSSTPPKEGGPPTPSEPKTADPLAALMAPPPVRLPGAGGAANPLASMMAPPSRTPVMYAGGRGRRGGPRPPPRGFAVFKPQAPQQQQSEGGQPSPQSAPATAGEDSAPPS